MHEPLKVPVLLVEREKVPVGVGGVPCEESVTVTVHGEAIPVFTGLVQETVVLVLRRLTVMLNAVLELAAWVESPA